ncbi:MAG TPA: DUF2130 domain-containing protein [Nitrospiraceae bacterium]|jgi:hypothetical protein|nr:DUF2130 domain-containing protein [Nitrospiraceae bacterium]
MTMSTIQCPTCGATIPLTEALMTQVRATVETDVKRQYEVQLQSAVKQAESRAKEQSERDLRLLREQLAEQQRKTREAQEAELALRKEKAALEERARELDLEVARRVDAEKQKLEEQIRRSATEEQALKLREKDKQIDDLKALLEEARRKSEQGSQERQGEVLELDLETALARAFPHDAIRPVPKGMRGADVIQEVRDGSLRPCGSIIWETKNTKAWSPAWLAKLKDDQRAAGAGVAVLVSVTLPEDVRPFKLVDGVWVTSLSCYLPLAVALREQLLRVAFAQAAAQGMSENMEALYRYLSSDEFRHRVEALMETFAAMQAQLAKERTAMEKLWNERAKQIERLVTNTAGMYGAIRGAIGGQLPEIPALDLEALPQPEEPT